jgi:hypothetical protein
MQSDDDTAPSVQIPVGAPVACKWSSHLTIWRRWPGRAGSRSCAAGIRVDRRDELDAAIARAFAVDGTVIVAIPCDAELINRAHDRRRASSCAGTSGQARPGSRCRRARTTLRAASVPPAGARRA